MVYNNRYMLRELRGGRTYGKINEETKGLSKCRIKRRQGKGACRLLLVTLSTPMLTAPRAHGSNGQRAWLSPGHGSLQYMLFPGLLLLLLLLEVTPPHRRLPARLLALQMLLLKLWFPKLLLRYRLLHL